MERLRKQIKYYANDASYDKCNDGVAHFPKSPLYSAYLSFPDL